MWCDVVWCDVVWCGKVGWGAVGLAKVCIFHNQKMHFYLIVDVELVFINSEFQLQQLQQRMSWKPWTERKVRCLKQNHFNAIFISNCIKNVSFKESILFLVYFFEAHCFFLLTFSLEFSEQAQAEALTFKSLSLSLSLSLFLSLSSQANSFSYTYSLTHARTHIISLSLFPQLPGVDL